MSGMVERMPRSAGFTLIEILVVTGILGLVMGVITACLAGGIRAWDAARTFSRLEGPVLADLALLEKDLARMTAVPVVECRGDGGQFVFAAAFPPAEGEGAGGVGAIRYVFDSGRRALMRKQWIFPAAEPPDGSAEVLLSGLESIRIEYGSGLERRAGTSGSGWRWTDSWAVATNTPGGIRIELTVGAEGRTFQVYRTFLSGTVGPVGGNEAR